MIKQHAAFTPSSDSGPGQGPSVMHAVPSVMEGSVVPGVYRIKTTAHETRFVGHEVGQQPAGWGLAAWHNNDTKRDGHSSWVCVHSGDKWPCDWTVAPGRSPGTSRERNIHAFCQLG